MTKSWKMRFACLLMVLCWPPASVLADSELLTAARRGDLFRVKALLAAKAGATFVSPFVGRHDDNGFDGMQLIADIRLIYDNYGFDTEILVASVRHPVHVLEAAKIGADIMTAPPAVIRQLVKHPLTDKGIEGFLADWAKTGQKIL